MERLDKIIAAQGQYTRKDIKKLAASGSITVDGVMVIKPDIKVDPDESVIKICGRTLNIRRRMVLLLNKPKGYTSTVEGNRRDMIMELVPPQLMREDLMPAGRLERDASGLMILTDDGELAHNILSPRKLVRKIYEIALDVPVTEKMAASFAEGIQISAEENKSATLEITGENTCRVTTLDGRYFQIKRMFEVLGANVTELHRICIGNLFLPINMEFGECRELTEEEVSALQESNYK